MKKIVFIIGLIFIIFTHTGCYEDHSTIATISMPNIILKGGDTWSSGLQAEFNAYLNEECNIYCPIDWGDTDSTKFSFSWTLNEKVISTDRSLRYTFTEMGTSYVLFNVMENETGLSKGMVMKVNVSSKFLLGWLILSEKENRTSLDFIHIDTYELYPDVYKDLYPEDNLGSKPYRLEEHFTSAYDQVMVLQRGAPGSLLLDGRNFKKVMLNKDEFIGEKYPYEGFETAQICYSNGTISGVEILLSAKGEIYVRLNKSVASRFQTAMYPPNPVEYTDGRGMRISHFTFPKITYFQLMFDELNNRWLAIYKSSTNDKMLPPLEKKYDKEAFPGFFDFCEGMPSNIELVYAQTCDEWSTSMLVNILKDKNNGKYYFQKSMLSYNSGRSVVQVSEPDQVEFASGYPINEETVFWMLRGQNTYYQASPHVFFNIGSKVYFYRYQTQQVYLFKDCSLSENPPSGKIVSMHTNPKTNEFGIAFSDGHFYICRSGSQVIEAIVRGDINPQDKGTNDEIEIAHFTGLGNIVHSIFKYGRFSNYSSAEDKYR
jgi:hypothetical protein